MSNVVSTKSVEEAKPVHPLANFMPTSFQSFDDWLARWNSATVTQERLGLLHCMQTIEYWLEKTEQSVFFLLDVANGWETGNPFRCYHRHYNADDINKSREIISRKAFDVLCVKLFASGKQDYPPLWWWMLEKQETFDKLLNFCGPEARNYYKPFAGGQVSHQVEVYGSFLQEFSRLGWTYSRRSNRQGEVANEDEIRARLVAARPQFIDILRYLGQLNWLNRPMGCYGGDFPELDKPSISKLREIVFETELLLPPQDFHSPAEHSRKPKNLREAILGASVAAEVLVLNDIRLAERNRIKAAWRKSRRKHENMERISRLEKIEKAKRTLDEEAARLTGQ